MKPLISYYGGKQRIAKKILEYFPPHHVYVEPFVGGAALLFAKESPQTKNQGQNIEVINDKDELLINLYRMAQDKPLELAHKLKLTLFSQSEYKKSVQILRNHTDYTDLEKAWAYYTNIEQGFANTIGNSWGIGKKRNLGHELFIKNERLLSIFDRLKYVHISCEDALACIKRWDSPNTFFYLDPPYPNTNQGHYTGYTLKDWTILCDTLDQIQGSYILSGYYQHKQPQSVKRVIQIQTKSTAAAGSNTEMRTEILWICDRSKKRVINHV